LAFDKTKILLDNLPKSIVKQKDEMDFLYVENKKQGVMNKLNGYLNRAVSFDQLHYNDSIALKIDDLIGKLNRCAQTHELDEECDKCEMAFVALAAPSLVGKTQLSFILRHRSLYFALSQYYSFSQSESIQNIYLNFESLNEMIFECSIKDIEKIKCYLAKKSIMTRYLIDGKLYEYLSANYMAKNMIDEKFMVLGLLFALVEDAENTFDNVDDNVRPAWMYHHAKRHDMKVKGASIRDIWSALPRFERYFVFLDEFTESINNVYIRNIIRASGLTCFVANTNTVVANLVSKTLRAYSRLQEPSIWSFVITDLDTISFKVLESTTMILENLKILTNRLPAVEGKLFQLFFDHFIMKNFRNIRPGMGEYIDAVIRNLILTDFQENLSSDTIIDALFQNIYEYLVERKESIEKSMDGRIANFALHSSVAFGENLPYYPSYFGMKNFLRDHLFYIRNPMGANNWIFKLIGTTSSSCPLIIRVSHNGVTSRNKWIEVSQFKKDELFTTIACMFGGINLPVARLMLNSSVRDLSIVSTSNFPNPRQKSSSGLDFEVMASISIVDSSHYSCCRHEEGDNEVISKSSLSGVTFHVFLQNLLRNVLVFDCDDLTKKRWIELALPKDLELFLKKFHVPFLNSTNMDWSPVLCQIFPLQDSRGSIRFGTFERTANLDQIDGRFDLLRLYEDEGHEYSHEMSLEALNERIERISNGKEPELIPEEFKLEKFDALLECKDRHDNLNACEILKILGKFLFSGNSKFGFIFCSKLGGFHKNNLTDNEIKIKELLEFLESKNINLYRIENETENISIVTTPAKFKACPFRLNSRISNNPRLTVFILPCAVLNSQEDIPKESERNRKRKRNLFVPPAKKDFSNRPVQK
jgi:hypothetical protein